MEPIPDFLQQMADYFVNGREMHDIRMADVIKGKMELDNVIRFLDATKRGCENGDDQSVGDGDHRTCRFADFGLCSCSRVQQEGTRS